MITLWDSVFIVTVICFIQNADAGRYFTFAVNRLSRASTFLTGDFLHNLVERNPGKTQATSVYPLLCDMGQLALFARGPKHQQLMELLNLRNDGEIRTTFPIVLNDLESATNGISKFDLKVYTDTMDPFSAKFRRDYKNIFSGETGTVDYSRPRTAAKLINNWVRSQIINPIGNQDIINGDMIRENNGLIFVGAYNFFVNWDHPFNPRGVTNIDFYAENGVVLTTPALYGNGYLRYARIESLGAQILEMPLKIIESRSQFIAIIILPDNMDNILGLLKNLRNPSIFEEALKMQERQCLTVYVPISKLNIRINLGESLKQTLNTTEIFNQFNGVTQSYKPIGVSSILHRLNIISDDILNEENRANTTTTATVEELCGTGSLPVVAINGPFIFYVLQKYPRSPGIFVFGGLFT